MKKTTNLQLNKPDKDDFYNIDIQNENMDIIDEKVADLTTCVTTTNNIVSGHTAKLQEQSKSLQEHSTSIQKHATSLQEHSTALQAHSTSITQTTTDIAYLNKYNSMRHPPVWITKGTIEENVLEKYEEGFSGGVFLIADTMFIPSDLPTTSTWVVIEWCRNPSAWVHLTAYVDGSIEIFFKQFVAIRGDSRRIEWNKIITNYDFSPIKATSEHLGQYFDAYWECANAWALGFYALGFGVVIPLATTKNILENFTVEAKYNGEWVALTNIETARIMGNLYIIAQGLPEGESGKCFLVKLNGTIK